MVIRLAYTIDSDNSHKFRQFIMNRLMGRAMYENVCIPSIWMISPKSDSIRKAAGIPNRKPVAFSS